MVQLTDDMEIIPPTRPTFLKVLCILTFIGSGYGIINSVYTYFNADQIANMMTVHKGEIAEDIKNKNGKDKQSDTFMKKIMTDVSKVSTPESLRKTSIGNAVSSLICLFGALLMWKLRRAGFYLYILGTAIGIILPFFLLGSNFITNLSAGIYSFIGILFIIFYAMNLKSMK